MKLKRILSLAVALVMVLSIVPAFSLTASAATETTKNIDLTNSFSIRSNGNVESNLLVFGSNSGGRRVSLLGITIPELAENEEITSAVLVMTTAATSNGNTRVYVDDASSIWNNTSTSVTWAQAGDGAALGDEITNVLVENKGANQVINFDITSFVKSNVKANNDFIALRMYNFLDSGDRNCCQFYPASNAKKPYLVLKTVSRADVTVNYVDQSGKKLGSFTDTALVGDSYTAKYVNNDNYIVIENETADENGVYGYLAKLVSSDPITIAESGNVVTATVQPVYQLKSANKVENGDFETGDLAGYDAAFATSSNFAVVEGRNKTGNYVLKHTQTANYAGRAYDGIGGDRSFQKLVNGIESGKQYFYSIQVYQNGNTPFFMNYSFTDGNALKTDDNQNITGGTAYILDGCQSSIANNKEVDGDKTQFNNANQWHSYDGIVTATDATKAFEFDGYYFVDAKGSLIDNVMFYEIEPAVSEHTVTVKYQHNGTDVDNGNANEQFTELEGIKVTAPAKKVVTDTAVYYFDAKTFTVGNTDTTEVNEASRVVKVDGGMIAHYSLESDITDPVNNYNGKVIGSTGITYNANGYATFPGGTEQGAIELPNDVAKALDGNFTISMWVRQDSSYTSDGKAITFWDMASENYRRFYWQQKAAEITIQERKNEVYNVYSNNSMKGEWALLTASFDLESGTLTTYVNGEAIESTKTNKTWSTNNAPANVVSDCKFYLGHNQWNNGDNPEMKGDMAEVRIYNKALTAEEVKALIADKKTVTVKYEADGAEIATETTVDYFSDTATIDLPTTITTAQGKAYQLTGVDYAEGAATATVTTSGPTHTATYESTVATANGFEPIADVTVIEGNAPVLPKTVTLTTDKVGVTYEANVTSWDTTNLAVGDNTVTGTLEGYDIKPTVKVTVLKCDDDSLAGEFNANKGNGGSVKTFNVSATAGTVVYEFDAVFNTLNNSTISIGDTNGGTRTPAFGWGGDAISIQTNTSGINVRAWSNGNATVTSSDAVVTTGKKYRFFITANVDNKVWSGVMTDENGKQTVIAKDNGYRNGDIDALDGIAVFDFGDNAVENAITISNLRVNWAAGKDYTVTVEGAGENNKTDTVKATSAAGVEVPHFEGYVLKTRTVSDTSITLTYAKNVESLGTWAIRNDAARTNKWVTETRFLGTHNSFTDKMQGTKDYVDEAGVLYGDSGAKAAQAAVGLGAGEATVNKSKAQSMDALEQLNAGVRYFDIRLSRQSDGTFWTRHGLLSEDFEGIAYTIAQFAEENPGEVIILDFQSTYDAMYTTVVSGGNNGGSKGDDNEAVYAALVELLNKTGITKYRPSNWDQKYNDLTNNGKEAKIILLCKARGASAENIFVNRSSVISTGDIYTESSDAQTVINYIDANYTNIQDSGAFFGRINAYTTGSNLISDAATNNDTFLAATNFKKWFQDEVHATFLLMDGLTDESAAKALARMQEYNRDGYNSTYSNTVNGVKVEGASKNVPFSTVLNVSDEVVTVEGYTSAKKYSVSLTQFSATPSNVKGDVTLTFPKASADNTTYDVLLSEDGATVLKEAAVGEAIVYTTSTLGNYVLATKAVPLGVSLVNGAQVRIGGGVDEKTGKVLYDDSGNPDLLKGSGLRFIAKVDKTDTLAATENAEIGILIYPTDAYTADQVIDFNTEISSGNIVVIPAVNMQDEATFSAALTNLKESNYNRRFTAKPYVKIGGTYYTDDNSATRSIYEVAAGLMVKNLQGEDVTTDKGNKLEQAVGEKGIAVLNAYLNQVGIRLTISGIAADGTVTIREESDAKKNGEYTGVPFFEITDGKTGANGVYTIKLTALGNATFKNFWQEYVRINNNHGAVINGISNASITVDSEDAKTLTFTFTYSDAKPATK